MLHWFSLSLIVVLIDQITKLVASVRLEYARPVEILPVFDITLLHNTGAAWSFLSDAGGWQRWLFVAIAVGVSSWLAVWLARLDRRERMLGAALALVLGGAVGNLIDRIWLGYVVDFISVHWEQHYFPAFNIADSAITVGAILLVVDAFFPWRRSEPVGVESVEGAQ